MREMLIANHLEEVDDLKNHGRDGTLIDTAENRKMLAKQVEAIVSKVRQGDKRAILFITSSRIRAIQTAELIAEEIKKEVGDRIHFRFSSNKNLTSPDQGLFILPEGYKPGDFFEGLEVASKIFLNESLGRNNIYQNLNYKFGDPVLLEDGKYKYPELLKYFESFGETYGSAIKRIFQSVIDFSAKFNKNESDSNTEIIVVGHGFGFHVMRGLSILSKNDIDELLALSPEDVSKLIYKIFKEFDGVIGELGCYPVDIESLRNPLLIGVLQGLVNKI